MKLHFRALGKGKPLIIMHGVFGSSDNWKTIGKSLAGQFKVYLVDLRNHGGSPHKDAFDYDLMVKDIMALMKDKKIEKAHVMGHSMGGKVAMHLATQHPDKIEKLIIVDIAPKYYPPHHQQIFKGFHSINLNTLKNRKDADHQMSKMIPDFKVRQFILKNLHRNKDGSFRWKLNVEAIELADEEISKSLPKDASFDGDTLFISGGKSDYIVEDDHDMIRSFFPKAKIITIHDAGHWVHADKPQEVKEKVFEFLH